MRFAVQFSVVWSFHKCEEGSRREHLEQVRDLDLGHFSVISMVTLGDCCFTKFLWKLVK
jgi:hypothetical protein